MNKIWPNILNIINSINEIISSLGDSITITTALILLLASVLLFFWGYKVKKIALIVIGFCIGCSIGIFVIEFMKLTLTNEIILILVLGIIFGVFNYFLYFATIGLFGAITGFYLATLFSDLIKSEPLITAVICICFAVIGCIMALKINKIAFIILTSLFGFFLLRISFAAIKIFDKYLFVELIICFVLLISGIIFQFIDNFNIELPERAEKPEKTNK